ncbi:hypothetical protein Slin15195_G079840 [Septoria linicola]|uniref:SnoaL-like domain-containing protein n=1 Tax=Septoria linicola TaxID=215465 RepID=A0A9Q9AT52_9PEZI|nr:hypothetical protein Slin15195_G079840 [Septoria linicola]
MTSKSSSQDLRARMEATARALISAFEEGGDHEDPSLVNRDVTPDCTRHLLPVSLLEAFGMPADYIFDNASFQATYARDLKALRFKNNVISHLVIDTETRMASFVAKAEICPLEGDAYPYEQTWTLYFNDDGTKVKKVIEFCDKEGLLRMASASA